MDSLLAKKQLHGYITGLSPPISSQANQGLVAMDLVQFKHGFHIHMLS